MKRFYCSIFILALLMFNTLPLYCQNYLNLRYLDGSDKNIAFGSIQKITFDEPGDKINFILTDATTQSVSFNTMQKITTSDVGSGEPLPVDLITFGATVIQNKVALSWRTATEVNNYGFDIERNIHTPGWETIGFIQGNGTSNSPKDYSFMDSPKEGTKFQYRLKQIDINGKHTYSDIVSIDMEAPTTSELKQNFPNPFNPQTTIAYNISTEGFVTIRIYDVLGKEVASLVKEAKKPGSYEVSFDGSRLSSGMYICKMSSTAHSSITKMIIMK